jgi:hypothetical protein
LYGVCIRQQKTYLNIYFYNDKEHIQYSNKKFWIGKKNNLNFLIANESSQDAVTINLHISQT